jgi:hypothetical protein
MEVAMTIPNHQAPAKSESNGGCLSVLVRLTWIFGGSILVLCAIFVAQGKAPVLADIIFFSLALGLVLIRFIDIRYLKGETADNQPATLKHWRRYSIKLLLAAGFLYSLAKIVAHLNLI